MKHYKESLVTEISMEELDLDHPFYDGDERNEVDQIDDIWAEVPSIDIDVAIENLTKLKELGANRVYFYAHNDHRGYIFTGVKLEEKQ